MKLRGLKLKINIVKICGSLYRHPHNNSDEFFQYVEICLTKLANENKKVLCGDFNFDLLKTETNHLTQHFFNLLCSYGFLSHIMQPTRVTENMATVIDNIFSNNLMDDIISGNVLLNLSDHFAQLILVNKEQIDIKKTIAAEIILNIQMKVFGMMYQYKTGITHSTMLMIPLKTFFY